MAGLVVNLQRNGLAVGALPRIAFDAVAGRTHAEKVIRKARQFVLKILARFAVGTGSGFRLRQDTGHDGRLIGRG